MTATDAKQEPTLFGHPTGLFTLFFAEMWERFSYYGMRALLVFYMIKGFLQYDDKRAYVVYGAYTSLVYMTPYFGGMLADRVLGQRRAVILGGLLMAAGHLLMTVQIPLAFFVALGLLICGNGFFKPNISTMVGALYPKQSQKKDGGFTIFYMGINLGAAMSPIICGYVGETYGWHYGFGCATAGMLIGVAIFAAPTRVTQALIVLFALGTSVAMPFLQDTFLQLALRLFMSVVLAAAGLVAFTALGRGGLPAEVGAPPDPKLLDRTVGGVLRLETTVYVGALSAVGLFAFLVQSGAYAGYILTATGILGLAYLLYEAIFRCEKVARERMFVALILTFFSLWFWAFFEQAGSSLNNFTDRNVDRVFEERVVAAAEVGGEIRMRVPPRPAEADIAALPLLGQEQLGFHNGERLFTMTDLSAARDEALKPGASADKKVFVWKVAPDNVDRMRVGGAEVPASEFQAVNPVLILLLGVVFSALWTWLGSRGREPSTPFKFALGLLQLGLGFGVLWYGAKVSDGRGMVGLSWLFLSYLLQTTGELCLSPVGLSMITKLSPMRLVSTMMGAWFLATAFAQYLAGILALLTAVGHEDSGDKRVPAPIDTVHVYGSAFGKFAVAAVISSLVVFALVPLLKRWMHIGVTEEAPVPVPPPGAEASTDAA